MSSKTCTALVVEYEGADKKPKLVKKGIPLPNPADNQVLVKVSHVAQNPTDVQSLDNKAFESGAVLGCDFVGSVEEVGGKVTRLSKGDVVSGLIWGGEIKGLGGYAEYTVADEAICFKVPKNISRAEAATIPLASATAWLALFSKDCLNIDRKTCEGKSVLIWGGSSSVGLYAIQIAKQQGLKVLTTCSPPNFDLVRKTGADHVFNYKDSDVAQQISQAAPDLEYIFDTIGNEQSSVTASQALRESGGGLCTVRPGKANTEDVTKRTKVTSVLVWTSFLKDHQYAEFKWPASKEDHELASEFYKKLEDGWVEKGILKPNTPKVFKGLDKVEEGFQMNRDGKISAFKIVYEI